MEVSILFPTDPELNRETDSHGIRPFSIYNSSTSRGREVWLIVAMGEDGAIGRRQGLPWRIPEDMAHFKGFTMGRPVIMGRKTWESLPKRPLPGRRNIVVTGNPDYQCPEGERASSVEEAIAMCGPDEVPVVIGGAQVYRAALPFVTQMEVTRVGLPTPDADTFFPEFNAGEWALASESELMVSRTGAPYKFQHYTRK